MENYKRRGVTNFAGSIDNYDTGDMLFVNKLGMLDKDIAKEFGKQFTYQELYIDCVLDEHFVAMVAGKNEIELIVDVIREWEMVKITAFAADWMSEPLTEWSGETEDGTFVFIRYSKHDIIWPKKGVLEGNDNDPIGYALIILGDKVVLNEWIGELQGKDASERFDWLLAKGNMKLSEEKE